MGQRLYVLFFVSYFYIRVRLCSAISDGVLQDVFVTACVCVHGWVVWIRYQALSATCRCHFAFHFSCVCAVGMGVCG